MGGGEAAGSELVSGPYLLGCVKGDEGELVAEGSASPSLNLRWQDSLVSPQQSPPYDKKMESGQ